MKLVRNIIGTLRHPETVIRYQPLRVRTMFRWLQDNMLCRKAVVSRKSLLESVSSDEPLHILPSQGYGMVKGGEYFGEVCDAAIKEAQDIFNDWDESGFAGSKSYLRPLVTHENALRSDSRILSLATSDKMIKTVGRYLGCLPVLTYANVWYSPVIEESADVEGSQHWHLDHEDLKQMKVFVYCSDVDENAGPMFLVNASRSHKLSMQIDYKTSRKSKRLADHYFADIDKVKLTGKAGDIAFVDTSSCFHLGSRDTQKPRLLIALQYLGPQAYSAKTYNNPTLASAIVRSNPQLGGWLADFRYR